MSDERVADGCKTRMLAMYKEVLQEMVYCGFGLELILFANCCIMIMYFNMIFICPSSLLHVNICMCVFSHRKINKMVRWKDITAAILYNIQCFNFAGLCLCWGNSFLSDRSSGIAISMLWGISQCNRLISELFLYVAASKDDYRSAGDSLWFGICRSQEILTENDSTHITTANSSTSEVNARGCLCFCVNK